MKRILAMLLIISLVPLGIISAFAAEESHIYLDDVALSFENAPAEFDGTCFVPMQEFAAHIGAEVAWSFETNTATLTKGSDVLKISEESVTANLNGEEASMSKPMTKVNSILYVPIRFVSESFGYEVIWNSETDEIFIMLPKPITDIGHYYDIVNVTCSARQNDINIETNVLDMDYNTRWSEESQGAYVTLELAEVSPIAYIGLAMYLGDERQSVVSVQLSEDGENFKEVVTKFGTTPTLNMEAIDLGGVHNAKYVRVLGYGNTNNNWNSITELRVYAPYEDGTMPVDTSGPGGAANNTFENLPKEQQEVLIKLESLFERVYPWLLNLYDREEHGFYMAMSGKDDPNQHTALEMSDYAINLIKNYSDMWADLPEDIRQQWIDYRNDRQDPVTGLFIDKQGPVNDRETARNQASTYGMLTSGLKAKPRYTHPNDKVGGTSATDTTVLPEYMASPETYVEWIESWDWENNSWTGGDQTQQSLQYLNMLEESKYEKYKDTVLNWLYENQKPNGLWSDKINFNSISGLFKVGLICSSLGVQIPNVDAALESIAVCFEVDSPTLAHYVRNPISVMVQIANYGPEYAEKVRKITADNADICLSYIEKFLCPDGGFSKEYQKSMSDFGGVYGTHQLWEGDVDSTLMVMIARKEMYGIFGLTAPKLHYDNFWEILRGDLPVPNCYDERYDPEAEAGSIEGSEDFESFDISEERLGSLKGVTINANLDAKIVRDRDRANNKVLSLYYDGSQGSGPGIKIPLNDGAAQAQIKYQPGGTQVAVTEFDVKLVDCAGSPYVFYVSIGGAPVYALNFQGTGNLSLASRVDSSNVAYGGTFATIPAKDWYKVTVEYNKGVTIEDTYIKIYVDGELINTNQNYHGKAQNSSPASITGEIGLTYYKAGKGTIYLDNIKMYNK